MITESEIYKQRKNGEHTGTFWMKILEAKFSLLLLHVSEAYLKRCQTFKTELIGKKFSQKLYLRHLAGFCVFLLILHYLAINLTSYENS